MSRSQLLLQFNVPHHVFLVLVALHRSQRPSSATKGSLFFPQRTAKHLFPSTQLLLRTTKHPKTFDFPLHSFSSPSPSTPPNGRRTQQRFLLFFLKEFATKHEALKGSSFDFQIPGTNHLRMFCKHLTIRPLCLYPAIYHL